MEIIIPGQERRFRHQVDELCKDSEWWGKGRFLSLWQLENHKREVAVAFIYAICGCRAGENRIFHKCYRVPQMRAWSPCGHNSHLWLLVSDSGRMEAIFRRATSIHILKYRDLWEEWLPLIILLGLYRFRYSVWFHWYLQFLPIAGSSKVTSPASGASPSLDRSSCPTGT